MSVLGIDTSSRLRVVAVIADREGRLERADVRIDGSVGTALPAAVAALLRGVDELEACVVVVGPGSYTGLRAGMAAALGVAEGRRVPLHGAGTLEVVAAGAAIGGAGGAQLVAVDAGRGFVYAASPQHAAQPRRLAITAAEMHGAPVGSPDALPLEQLVHVDAATALAAAVPPALARPALPHTGLAAVYVE